MGLQLRDFGRAVDSVSLEPGDVFVAHMHTEIALCVMCEPIAEHPHFLILGGQQLVDPAPALVSAESLPSTVAKIEEPVSIRPRDGELPYLVAEITDVLNGNLVTSANNGPAILVMHRGLGRNLVQFDGKLKTRSSDGISYKHWSVVVHRGGGDVELASH